MNRIEYTETSIKARNAVNAVWNECFPAIASILKNHKGKAFNVSGSMTKSLKVKIDEIRPDCHYFRLSNYSLEVKCVCNIDNNVSYQTAYGSIDVDFHRRRVDYVYSECVAASVKHRELLDEIRGLEADFNCVKP